MTIDYTGTYTRAQLLELRNRRIGWTTGTDEDHAAEAKARAAIVAEALVSFDAEPDAIAVELDRTGEVLFVVVESSGTERWYWVGPTGGQLGGYDTEEQGRAEILGQGMTPEEMEAGSWHFGEWRG